MKMNFKLIALTLIVFASNVEAVTFAGVKESASKTVNYNKEKLVKAGKWVSDHKKEVIIGGAATVATLAAGIYIYKLRNTINGYQNEISKLQNLRNQLYETQNEISKLQAGSSDLRNQLYEAQAMYNDLLSRINQYLKDVKLLVENSELKK